jgi:hypothetical protein
MALPYRAGSLTGPINPVAGTGTREVSWRHSRPTCRVTSTPCFRSENHPLFCIGVAWILPLTSLDIPINRDYFPES